MTFDARVLRAMLRLARKCEAATLDAVAVRVGGNESDIGAAWERLEADGLVDLRPMRPPTLTLAGLAVAVASLPVRPVARKATRRSSRAA